MNTKWLLFTISVTLICAVSAFAQDVDTDYDRLVDFNKYRTYSWTKVQTDDDLWPGHIRDAVNSALAAKGWKKVAAGGDVAIIAMEMTKDHQSLNTYYDIFEGGWGWRWAAASAMPLHLTMPTRWERLWLISSTQTERN